MTDGLRGLTGGGADPVERRTKGFLKDRFTRRS